MGFKLTKEAQKLLLTENLTNEIKQQIIKSLFNTDVIDENTYKQMDKVKVSGKTIFDYANKQGKTIATNEDKVDILLSVLKSVVVKKQKNTQKESTKNIPKVPNKNNKRSTLDEDFENDMERAIYESLKDSKNNSNPSLNKNTNTLNDSFDEDLERAIYESLKDNKTSSKPVKNTPTKNKNISNVSLNDQYDEDLERAILESLKDNKTSKKANDKKIEKEVQEILKSRNIKKPSFSLFKSFIRFFNKNAYQKDYDVYQRDLKKYNDNVEEIRSILKALNDPVEPQKNISSKNKLRTRQPNKNISKKNINTIDLNNNFQQRNRNIPSNFLNLFSLKRGMEYDGYADMIMSQKTGLKINEQNAEYIALGSFNVQELTDLQEYIKDKDELKHLDIAISHKINKLLNVNPKNITKDDKPYTCRENSYFIVNSIGEGFINDIRENYNSGVFTYNALSNNPNNRPHFSKQNVINANNKINNRPQKENNETKYTLVQDGQSLFLNDVPKTEVQSSNNGCWSCSMNILLKGEGVTDLTQGDIRAFRPNSELDNVKTDNPMQQIKDRIEFAYRANNDKPNEIGDYSDIIHKTTKNVALVTKQITGSVNEAYNQIANILYTKKKPISFLYAGHYRTIVGIDKGNLILEDSMVRNNNNYYDVNSKDKEYYKNKYPNHSVESINHFTQREITLSYLENLDNIKVEDYAKNNMQGMDEKFFYTRKEGRTFTKFNEINGAFIQEDIILPNDYLRNVKHLDGVTLKEGNKERIEVHQLNENFINNSLNTDNLNEKTKTKSKDEIDTIEITQDLNNVK